MRRRRSFSERPAPFSFRPGVTELDFVDWPAAIGIDNLTINTPDAHMPEPASLVLFGTGLLAVGSVARRRKQK